LGSLAGYTLEFLNTIQMATIFIPYPRLLGVFSSGKVGPRQLFNWGAVTPLWIYHPHQDRCLDWMNSLSFHWRTEFIFSERSDKDDSENFTLKLRVLLYTSDVNIHPKVSVSCW